MKKVVSWSFNDNFIGNLADYILKNFSNENCDFSRLVCVFGGRRPALFLRRKLSQKIKKAFLPPRILSIDDWVEYVVEEAEVSKIGDLDAAYLIYTLVKKLTPSVLGGRPSFSQFLPWAREIASFIDQLDLENISNQSLTHVEKSAQIGYEVPQSINELLRQIGKIRKAYHQVLEQEGLYSRGRLYLSASEQAEKKDLSDIDAVVFCGFFYLQRTEKRIIKEICDKGKGVCVFHGSQDNWQVLGDNAKHLQTGIKPDKEFNPSYNLSLYQGVDTHSQVGVVRHVLNSNIDKKENTVIVVPRSQTLIPLLTEISSVIDQFNVSMGYPLQGSSLYVLFNALFKAQESKKDKGYYTKDYLNLLRHPLVKNLKIINNSAFTRVMVHKIEELLAGSEESSIGGSLFLSLDEIEGEEKIYQNTVKTMVNMNVDVGIDECKQVLSQLHSLLFHRWEKIQKFSEFAINLGYLLNTFREKSTVWRFSVNLKAMSKIYDIKDELENVSFRDSKFNSSEIWEVFQQKLAGEVISFIGSPLKGLQVLGLFESRSLNFENVIVMDMNESVLPKLKIHQPLVPREVMLCLGIDRLEKEEEIQRYQFMRLIGGAKNVHLIYEENQEKEKSRFIEELLWNRQKEQKKLDVITIPKAQFLVKATQEKRCIEKTAEMIEHARGAIYSATRVNVYLNCPLRFYYQYILGLREKEDLLGDPDASHIGRFIHELLEETFARFKGEKPVIDDRFRKYFHKKTEERFEEKIARRMRSDSYLLKKIIANRLDKFLDKESKEPISKIICLEEEKRGLIRLGSEEIRFKYMVDRIDELEDRSIMIIDYKTGSIGAMPKSLSGLESMEMTRESIKNNIKSFQLPLYYHLIAEEFPDLTVNAQLYSIRKLDKKSFICEADLQNRDKIMRVCLKALEAVFAQIFDPNIAFEPDKDERKCRLCPFISLCR
jgi:ATP-dependent helicase/DNAse subunit B